MKIKGEAKENQRKTFRILLKVSRGEALIRVFLSNPTKGFEKKAASAKYEWPVVANPGKGFEKNIYRNKNNLSLQKGNRKEHPKRI